jgi:hypothetical protein
MRRELIYEQAAAVPVLMQVPASVIAVPISVPRAIAPPTIAVPTIARIKAYSAAEAPLSSRKNEVTNLTIIKPLIKN